MAGRGLPPDFPGLLQSLVRNDYFNMFFHRMLPV